MIKNRFMSCHVYLLIYALVTIIDKNLYFRFIQLIMYIIFIIDHIHHLINESKILIFNYNSGRRMYYLSIKTRNEKEKLLNS